MKKNERGFSAVEIILVLLVVGLIGVVGFMVYKNHNKTTNNSTANTTTTTTPPTTATPTTTTDPNKGYLVVKEWDVRLKEATLTQDSEYTIKDDHTLYLTTKTYVDKIGDGSCKANGSTGQLIRGKAGYDYNGSGSKIENYSYDYKNDAGKTVTVSSVKVGDYYYFWEGPQAPCANPTDANVKIMNSYQLALSDLAFTVQALPN